MAESNDGKKSKKIGAEKITSEPIDITTPNLLEWRKGLRGLVTQFTSYFRITKILTPIITGYILVVLLLDGMGVLEMDTVALSVLIGANGGAHMLGIVVRMMGNITGEP